MTQRVDSQFTTALGFVVAATLSVCVGCDSGPPIAPVVGTVTYKGQPVPEGTVTFYPQAGGRPAVGQIQSDGSYNLAYLKPGDGAVLGAYKVAIESRRVTNVAPGPKSFTEELAAEGAPPPPPVKVEWLVPEKYSSAESSGLTATVEDKSNVIDFKLP
jgi:hypothetical protein